MKIEERLTTKPKRNRGFRDKLTVQFFIVSPPKNKFGVKILKFKNKMLFLGSLGD